MVVVDTHEADTLADPGMGLEGQLNGIMWKFELQAIAGGKNKRGGGVILCTHTPIDTIQSIPKVLE